MWAHPLPAAFSLSAVGVEVHSAGCAPPGSNLGGRGVGRRSAPRPTPSFYSPPRVEPHMPAAMMITSPAALWPEHPHMEQP